MMPSNRIIFSLFFVFLAFGFANDSKAFLKHRTKVESTPQKNVIAEMGLTNTDWGLSIDAVYDNRLDNLIPNYKILNVVLSNRGKDIIYLDPKKDRWRLIDSLGKKHKAINTIRFLDEKNWAKLPSGLVEKLAYPMAVRVGKTTKIDLIFSNDVDLKNFREIYWKSKHFNREFVVQNTFQKELELVDNDSELDLEFKGKKSYQQSLEKYDGETEADSTNPSTANQENQEDFNKPKKFDPMLDEFSIPMD